MPRKGGGRSLALTCTTTTALICAHFYLQLIARAQHYMYVECFVCFLFSRYDANKITQSSCIAILSNFCNGTNKLCPSRQIIKIKKYLTLKILYIYVCKFV